MKASGMERGHPLAPLSPSYSQGHAASFRAGLRQGLARCPSWPAAPRPAWAPALRSAGSCPDSLPVQFSASDLTSLTLTVPELGVATYLPELLRGVPEVTRGPAEGLPAAPRSVALLKPPPAWEAPRCRDTKQVRCRLDLRHPRGDLREGVGVFVNRAV